MLNYNKEKKWLTQENQIRDIDLAQPTQKTEKNNTTQPTFKDTLANYINEANDLSIKADRDIQRMIAGEEVDVHEVMTAVEKASISFEMVMEIRNKMLEAYREVMKTGI
jgi:flagellar hook-basal body complex protein FliE